MTSEEFEAKVTVKTKGYPLGLGFGYLPTIFPPLGGKLDGW